MAAIKSFPLVGNLPAAETVSDALVSGRMPHAIIIEGEEGTGRHTLARYIAAGAVCPNEHKPCGQCNSCHIAEVGSHPDISFITPEEGKKSISVDTVRALRTEAYLKPSISSRRVFIIDPADSMSEVSQNALLKVLEEPPAGTVFVLISSSAAELLPTVRSRCVKLTLTPVGAPLAEQYIRENTVGFSDSDIKSAVSKWGGNIGNALKFLEGGGDIVSDAEELVRLALLKKTYDMLLIFKKYERDRVKTDQLFSSMLGFIVTRLRGFLNTSCFTYDAKRLSALYDSVRDASARLGLNINLQLLFAGFCSQIK